MSGVLPAWILVMISWLMLVTVCQLILIFDPWAASSALSCFSRPALTGGSTLDQIVTVLLPLPPLPPPPPPPLLLHADRVRPALTSNVAPTSVILCAWLLMSAPQLSGPPVRVLIRPDVIETQLNRISEIILRTMLAVKTPHAGID